ncbi:PREDICTED: probable peroxygenase 4 [Lupinus angustifolius]|uniref:probable peroxygenase 4 n=1 Tax=Lupinus angustifolius TaxID=3871 RepID=UPI00092FAE0E|nr:PREDICTED: probable peroxygenase 4 [Lupinus angustifolius]
MATLTFSNKDNKNQEGLVDKNPIKHDQTVLQKHVTFFDRNHDGLIYPWETFQGFRAIGCGYLLSTVAAVFINGGLSSKTRQGKFSILFPIEVKNIHGGKHGSDSGVYDTEGRFVPSKFEEIFSNHAKKHPNALTSDELMGMLKANRVPKDYKGWVASYVEWKILYVLAKDNDGLLQKETLHAVYDGSLFERMEKEHSEKKNK